MLKAQIKQILTSSWNGIYDRRRVLENEIINGSINGPEGNGVTFDFTNTPGGDNGLGPFKIFD
jgi:hypothetical protein